MAQYGHQVTTGEGVQEEEVESDESETIHVWFLTL